MSSQGRHNDLENPRRFTECLVQPPSSPPITAAYCTTHSEAQISTYFFLYHWTCKISVLYFPDTLSTTHRRSSEKCHSATALTCFLQPTRSPHSLSDPARLTSGRNVDREIHIGKEHDAAETDSANTPWTPLTLGRTSLHTRAEAWEYVHLRQNHLARLGILQS